MSGCAWEGSFSLVEDGNYIRRERERERERGMRGREHQVRERERERKRSDGSSHLSWSACFSLGSLNKKQFQVIICAL